MGFSVSASAAIIFISFLMVAVTLYNAWDNVYAEVQAAQKEWYDRKLSQMYAYIDVNVSAVNNYTVNNVSYYSVGFSFQNRGNTQYVPYWSGVYDGNYVTLYNLNDDGVGWVSDYTYLLPGETVVLTIQDIPLDGEHHTLKIVLDNGCWLLVEWHDYFDNDMGKYWVSLDSISRGCPTEVN